MQKVHPPEHLKNYIDLYIISKWKTGEANFYFPAWVKNLIFFQTGIVSELELLDKKIIEFPTAMVAGCITQPSRFIRKNTTVDLISVQFKPMVLYNYIQRDTSFLTDKPIQAESIFHGSQDVNLQLLKESDDKKKIEIINTYFSKIFQDIKISQNVVVQSVLDEFNNNLDESLSYKEILTQLDISVRHSRRIFKKIMGISPHLYHRINKLENIIIQLKNNPDQKFINLMKSYADQSHFIRDFVRFTNRNPEDFKKMLVDVEKRKRYEYL